MPELVLSVSDFVAVFNQTIDMVYPTVTIVGELANFKVSKNRWLYFDLKDDQASVRFFGTVYALPGPLEDGLQLEVSGQPRLHPNFGFSINVTNIRPVGAGSIKKAAALLEAKLQAEGLFAPERKRPLPYPPNRIGLITSDESAAYADFLKILNARWGGLDINHVNVQVQGELAPNQIAEAIAKLNTLDLDVIVITRGGGSADDLGAFSNETLVRAVASSRTPTLVAIGHEVDTSLAELAADVAASTPSNAAELLVPDRQAVRQTLKTQISSANQVLKQSVNGARQAIVHHLQVARHKLKLAVTSEQQNLATKQLLLGSYNPNQILKRGYILARQGKQVIRRANQVQVGSSLTLGFYDGTAEAEVTGVKRV